MGAQPGAGVSVAAGRGGSNGQLADSQSANGRASARDLWPLGVVDAPEAGGWVVVNLTTLRVVEPGYVWPDRAHAEQWARDELDRERQEEADYRRRQDEPVERGLARSWAATHRNA